MGKGEKERQGGGRGKGRKTLKWRERERKRDREIFCHYVAAPPISAPCQSPTEQPASSPSLMGPYHGPSHAPPKPAPASPPRRAEVAGSSPAQDWPRPQCGGQCDRGLVPMPQLAVPTLIGGVGAHQGLAGVCSPPPAATGRREHRGHLPPQLSLASTARNRAPGQDGNCGPEEGTALASAGGRRVARAGDSRCS